MSAELRREVSTFFQYVAMALVASVGAFVWWAWPGGDWSYNLGQTWKYEGAYVRAFVLAFVVLGVLRLAVIYLSGRTNGKSLD